MPEAARELAHQLVALDEVLQTVDRGGEVRVASQLDSRHPFDPPEAARTRGYEPKWLRRARSVAASREATASATFRTRGLDGLSLAAGHAEQPRRRRAITWPRLSGSASQPDGPLVAASRDERQSS